MQNSERRYSIQDYERDKYFQVPKMLLKGRYKEITNNERVVYAVLKDRFELSIKNKWVDQDGYIFFYFKQETLADECCISVRTIKRTIQTLKDVGLLMTVQQGLNMPNRLYLLKPEEEIQEDENKTAELISYENDNKISKKEVANPVNIRKCQFDTSGNAKLTLQEVPELHSNITNKNKTDFNESLSLSLSEKDDREMEQDKSLSEKYKLLKERVSYDCFDEYEQQLIDIILTSLIVEVYEKDKDEKINIGNYKCPDYKKVYLVKDVFDKYLSYSTMKYYVKNFNQTSQPGIRDAAKYHLKGIYRSCISTLTEARAKYKIEE